MPQTLNEIKSLLAQHELHPKHRLGQNFLHDHNQMRKIVAAADLKPGELVLEVGPGTGALSEQLLDAGAKLIAIEVDPDLQPILEQRLGPYGDRAQLLMGDVLASKHALNGDLMAMLGNRPFKMVANLPYNIASPLLVNLLVDHPPMHAAVVMVQREVADRLAASPGGKDYGPLTVVVQAMCHIKPVAQLSPNSFWPPPKVSSTVLALRRRERPLTDNPQQLAAMVQRLFQRRRKQLGSILGRSTPLPPGIDPQARPETLSIAQFVELARHIGQETSDSGESTPDLL